MRWLPRRDEPGGLDQDALPRVTPSVAELPVFVVSVVSTKPVTPLSGVEPIQNAFEEVARLPRSQQDTIVETAEALVDQFRPNAR